VSPRSAACRGTQGHLAQAEFDETPLLVYDGTADVQVPPAAASTVAGRALARTVGSSLQ
jgi:hypothetical protein